MSYCSERISRKFRVMSFWAAITVVGIHSDPYALTTNPGVVAHAVESVLPYLFLWAVPFFFLTAGFFFARALSNTSSWSYRAFLGHKLKTLTVPYLLWGGIYGTLVGTPIIVAVNKSHGVGLWARTVFESGSHIVWFDRMFGLFHTAPANGALWFVRMLILFFFLAPLWRFVLIRMRFLLFVLGVALALAFGVDGVATSKVFALAGISFEISWGAFGYMFLGMFVAAVRAEEHRFGICECAALGVGAIFLSLLPLPRYCWISVMVVFYWALYDVIRLDLPVQLPECFAFSFWIYCMHHPLTGYFGAVLRAVLGRGECSYCLQLLLIPAMVVSFAVGCAFCTRRYFPHLFAILTGGR